MIGKKIRVSKTARYFLSSEITDETNEIWFVCHGYGQLANYFIKNFEVLNDPKRIVVAPEGLHRFYWNGFSGRVVASWMTREDREDDIRDYVEYLDNVYDELLGQLKGRKLKITVLGFSQGTATVCRWLANRRSAADHLVLWAGALPADMDLHLNKEMFSKLKAFLVIGDNDEFINEEEVEKYRGLLDEHKIGYELIRFRGKHEIHTETLKGLADKLQVCW